MTRSRAAFVLPTLAVMAASVALQLRPYTTATQMVSDWLQLALVGAALASAVVAGARGAGQARWFWALAATSLAIWGAGQIRYMTLGSAYFEGVDTVQNVLFLSMALPLLPALALRPGDAPGGRTRPTLDVTIVSVLVAFVYLYIVLSFPSTADRATYNSWRINAQWVVAITVPAAFVLRLRESVPPWRAVYVRLGIAMTAWFIGDAAVTVAMMRAHYRPGLLDLPWLLPFAWLIVIALQWRATPPPEEAPPTGWSDTRHAAIVALMALAAPSVLLFSATLVEASDPLAWRSRTWLTLMTSVVVAALFLARQIGVLDEFERSERRRSAQRRSSEERFSRAFHGVPLGAAILTEAEARVVDANERCLELLGRPRTAAVGRTLAEIDALEEAPIPWLASHARTGGTGGHPVRIRRATGEAIDVLAWFQALDGDEPCVLVLLQDQREIRRLQTEVIQAQTAEAVGRLAGAVAHDLNNLLTAIVGSTEVARERLTEPALLRQDLQHVVQAADRAAALTSRLLEYGRGRAETPQSIDIGTAVREAERTVRQLAGDAVTTELAVPPVRLQVQIDPAEFERILVNLVVNARDAMPGGGRLEIAVRPERVGVAEGRGLGLAPGRYVALIVRDSGEGISEAHLPRVFEPFFTTKGPDHGSGLGLSTVLETARRFGGGASIASTPGAGTAVTVHLPAADAEDTPAAEAAPAPPTASGRETLLLVEDEDAVREVVRRVLERQGYHVLEASSGPKALAIAETWTRPIDLLLTDVIMPDMNGPQLAAQLLALRPGLRVLYASGYAADALGPIAQGGGDAALIQKPFTPVELTRRVRQALDAPR